MIFLVYSFLRFPKTEINIQYLNITKITMLFGCDKKNSYLCRHRYKIIRLWTI